MRKVRVIVASLLLVMVLGVSGAIPSTAYADDKQGGGDSVKKPKCYPRCSVIPTGPASDSNSGQANETSASSNMEEFVEFLVLNFVSFLN